MFKIGKITQTFGLRGEVKVINLSDYERFKKGSLIYLDINNEKKAFEIENARINKNRYIIKLKGVDHINDVLKYVGLDLYGIKIESKDEDEVHFNDLINKKVVLEDNTYVGVVTSIMEVPQGHILEVKTNTKTVLIPFVKAFIGKITKESITIYPIEDLLWELIL